MKHQNEADSDSEDEVFFHKRSYIHSNSPDYGWHEDEEEENEFIQ